MGDGDITGAWVMLAWGCWVMAAYCLRQAWGR
jgi:hypothetical protein